MKTTLGWKDELRRTNDECRKVRHSGFGLLSAFVLLISSFTAHAADLRFGGAIPHEVESIYERGLAWLASKQNDEGAWQGGNDGVSRQRR
jgi:hypothetical protein